MATYDCKIIGDGKSVETAYRPAIYELAKAGVALSYKVIETKDGRATVEVVADKPTLDAAVAEVSQRTGGKVAPTDIVEKVAVAEVKK